MPAKPKRTESHKARNQIKKTVARRIEQSTKPSQITEVTNEQMTNDSQRKNGGFEKENDGAATADSTKTNETSSVSLRQSYML